MNTDHGLHVLAVAREQLDLVGWNEHTLDAQIAGARAERDQVRDALLRCWKHNSLKIAILAARRRKLNDQLRSLLIARRVLVKCPNSDRLDQARADLIIPHAEGEVSQAA